MTLFFRLVFTVSLFASFCLAKYHSTDCPCKNVSLCNNIQTRYEKELYGFGGGGGSNTSKNYDPSIYNWTYLTSIAFRSNATDDFMCTAHSHGVRLIYWTPANYPFTDDINVTMAWIEETFNFIQSIHFDGITFDYEGEMLWTSHQSDQYVQLVNLTTQYFHTHMPGSTISICVPFDAYLEWGRQYDYAALAEASDYLYIMDYDVQTQMYSSQCMAKAVSPYYITERGVQSYLNLGINASKLILGIPWYGRSFLCVLEEMDSPTSKYCPITPEEQRGVNCTSVTHADQEMPYAAVISRVYSEKWNITEIMWDDTMRTHYVNIYGHNNPDNLLQTWFDDADSLRYKYQYIKSKNLGGVGPFQFGDVFFDGSNVESEFAVQMWSAFDEFFV